MGNARAIRYVILSGLVILLSSLACSIDLGNDNSDEISTQQTLVALQMTQAALENPSDGEPVDDPILPPEETEPVIQQDVPDVNYEGISFSFNEAIADSVIPATIPGQNMGEESMPGDTTPTYFEFSFINYATQDHFHTPRIMVYPVDDYRAISPYASTTIDNLIQTLSDRPGGGNMSNFPFLPMWNAAQIFAAKVSYFDFQTGSGVRYLTMFGQAVYPVDNQNLFYTYQGITYDGRYYIAAVLPVAHFDLPYDGGSDIDDWLEFSNNWESYISDTILWLEGQAPDRFMPNLDHLDEMMASFLIDR